MEFWDHLLATGVGAAIGALAVKLWQRYLQRMVTIRWSVTHETLAAGGDDPRWGRVEILYNGNPAGTLLQWCRVEIENESGSRDLSDVVVSLQYDQPEPEILSGVGSLEGGNQGFSWTPMFTAELTSYFELPVADRPPSTDIFRRRDFVIPVLNRGAKAIFLFLVRPNISNQTLRVHCEHLSVRLKHRPTRWPSTSASSSRRAARPPPPPSPSPPSGFGPSSPASRTPPGKRPPACWAATVARPPTGAGARPPRCARTGSPRFSPPPPGPARTAGASNPTPRRTAGADSTP